MNTKYSIQLLFRFLSVGAVLVLALSPFGGALAKESATYVVNTTNDSDDGVCNKTHCSLREAINVANAQPGADIIAFDIPGAPPFSIQPLSPLPVISDPVTIDGATQRGYAGKPIVELDGTNAGEGEPEVGISGLVISAGDSTVRGLVINRFSGVGIILEENGGNTIQGNFLGTDVTGTLALGNAFQGVLVASGSSGNLISGNLISGNGAAGIRLSDKGTDRNRIQGNFIGTDINGTSPLGNGAFGIRITEGAAHNLIGGTEPGARNLISGNWDSGVYIDIEEVEVTRGNIVQGNYIGTDVSGAAALPNAGAGVGIDSGASNTLIGGADEGAGNLISGNDFDGVSIGDSGTTGTVVQGNFIGTDASGTAALPNGADGVRILGGASHTLIGGTEDGARNVISGNSYVGISIWDPGTSHNIIQGNYIGTDASGTFALPNSAEGVRISSGASHTLIGGTEDSARNVISGNGYIGVAITDPGTSENKVQGNLIGTDITGMSPLGNVFGIGVSDGAADNVIGGTEGGAGNVISGNIWWGVLIYGDGVTGNLVQGNFIGTDASGTIDLGHLGSGVFIGGGAADNLIGGTEPGAGNTIAFNGVGDTWAGIALDPSAGSGNALLSNLVYSNRGLGIDLNNDTFVTLNDPLDGDAGPNDLQNFPVITAIRRVGRAVRIYGTLESTPSTKFRLEFFSNEACDPSGYGEGQAFLGFALVTTNPVGFTSFNVPVSMPQGASVTATATDPAGSTSEFSQCFGP